MSSLPPEVVGVSIRQVLRNVAFRQYFLAIGLSTLGDTLMIVTMRVIVRDTTGSNSLAALVVMFMIAPSLLGPVVGTFVDRLQRRGVFGAVGIGMAIIVMLVPVGQTLSAPAIIYGVALLYGVTIVTIDSAQSGALASILEPAQLGRANGLLRTVSQGGRLVGPAVGVGIYSLIGSVPVAAIDALSFLAMAFLMLRIRSAAMSAKPSAPTASTWRVTFVQGLRATWAAADLRRTLLGVLIAFTAIGFFETIIFAVVTLGLHQKPAFVGVLSVIQGAVAIPASLAAGRFLDRVSPRAAAAAALGSFAVGTAVMISSLPWAIYLGIALQSLGMTVFFVSFATLIQKSADPSLQGRVAGASFGLLSAAQLVSVGLGAGLATVLDWRVIAGFISAFCVAGAITIAFAGRNQARSGGS